MADERTTLWESSGNPYNRYIHLSEPITHYDKIIVLGSGSENVNNGVHLSKNVYKSEPREMGMEPWGYSPWSTSFVSDYLLGCNMRVSGDSAFVGSAWYMGIGGTNASTFAAGKWVDANVPKMMMPYKIIGVDHKPVRNLTILQGDHGVTTADKTSGCEYDYVNLNTVPDEDWYLSGYNISGATLKGNKFMFGNEDVTVEPIFTDEPPAPSKLTIDLNHVGNDVTSEWRSQTRYPGNWTGLKVFACGTGANGSFTTYIKGLGNLSSNFNLLWLCDTHYGTSNSYGRGTYLVDNTQAFYGTCPYGSGQDSQYPRYQKSRYTSTTINVSKGGNLSVFLYASGAWYTNKLYFAIPEELVGEVINSK